jgi:hypothetical protein
VRPLFQTVSDLRLGAEVLHSRRYGVIEARDGAFDRVRLRPFPKIMLAPEILLLGRARHGYLSGDRCLIYYNQPRRFPNFLAVKYLVTSRGTRLATVRRALETLDAIARFKAVDALLCDVANWRLSTAIMVRLGWEPHCPSRWHRFFIRRFYGDYPSPAPWIAREEELAAV